MSSRNATRADFAACNPFNEKERGRSYYLHHTPRAAFNQVKDEFEQWLNPANGVIKAMISMD